MGRRFEVETPEGTFDLIYKGFGAGYEEVLVNGQRAAAKQTVFWFCPKFDFQIGSSPAVLEVRVWVWLKIKSLRLTVAGQTIYVE
jgi:hypothetical protein